MNLINEQSVTTSATTTTTSTTTLKELSPAESTRVRSSLESAAITTTTVPSAAATTLSLSLSLSLSSSSLPSSLTFSTFVCSSTSGTTSSSSSLSTVESINSQIENISNTISSSDANQINLIKKMPTTTNTTKQQPTTAGKTTTLSSVSSSSSSASPSSSLAATTTTIAIPTVNFDNVSDVSSDYMKNKNGGDTTTTTTITPEKERKIGCEHYKRRAMFVTPCCNKFYKCRYCHDENETHHFDRKTLTELICVKCNTRQKVQEQCEKCGVRFGKYTCLICNLFDDEDKNQYHCDGCGICRIGGRENFFHCEVCNMCLPIELKIEGHRCVENISRSNCPVCLGAIHTSRIPCHIPDCGHLLHKMCFDQLLASGHYVCPTCQTSLLDMTKMWEYLDAQALLMTVPKKYENQRVYIFCNDCHETCKTKFHFVGLKCIHCGGYNTTQDVKRRMSWVNGADSSTSA